MRGDHASPMLPRSLLRRNVVLMVGVVLAGQVVAGLLVMGLVIGPQVNRIAQLTADMVSVLTRAVEDLPPQRREAMLTRIGGSGNLLIRLDQPPLTSAKRPLRNFLPNFVEREFVRALTKRLEPAHNLSWRRGADDRLWFALRMGARPVWISVTPPAGRSALLTLLYALVAAFIVAAVAGFLLQRRLDAPLRRLATEVDAFAPDASKQGRPLPVLETDGPEEVAAVARAFNRMTARLAEDEAERTLMLAGVSHDLRTPLTRLRLCLEMMGGNDAQMEATATRQVERIEAMLEQFLDYARGFSEEPLRDCDIADMLRTVARDCDPQGQTEVMVDAPVRAELRYQAVGRAIGNLLGNALRHGQRPVRLDARREGGSVMIEVSDAGSGFDAVEAERLMRPFARGDTARGGDGAGLGLSIADRVAKAHGGRVRFSHSDGRFRAILDLPDMGAAAR